MTTQCSIFSTIPNRSRTIFALVRVKRRTEKLLMHYAQLCSGRPRFTRSVSETWGPWPMPSGVPLEHWKIYCLNNGKYRRCFDNVMNSPASFKWDKQRARSPLPSDFTLYSPSNYYKLELFSFIEMRFFCSIWMTAYSASNFGICPAVTTQIPWKSCCIFWRLEAKDSKNMANFWLKLSKLLNQLEFSSGSLEKVNVPWEDQIYTFHLTQWFAIIFS